jgi:hypothetical protein
MSPLPNFCLQLPSYPALCTMNSSPPTTRDACLNIGCCWIASTRKCFDPAYNLVDSGVQLLNPGEFNPTDSYIQLLEDPGFEQTVCILLFIFLSLFTPNTSLFFFF